MLQPSIILHIRAWLVGIITIEIGPPTHTHTHTHTYTHCVQRGHLSHRQPLQPTPSIPDGASSLLLPTQRTPHAHPWFLAVVSMRVCVHVSMRVCVHVSMRICVHVSMCVRVHVPAWILESFQGFTKCGAGISGASL
jgi:hypothetical protein